MELAIWTSFGTIEIIFKNLLGHIVPFIFALRLRSEKMNVAIHGIRNCLMELVSSEGESGLGLLGFTI